VSKEVYPRILTIAIFAEGKKGGTQKNLSRSKRGDASRREAQYYIIKVGNITIGKEINSTTTTY